MCFEDREKMMTKVKHLTHVFAEHMLIHKHQSLNCDCEGGDKAEKAVEEKDKEDKDKDEDDEVDHEVHEEKEDDVVTHP
jgi:hypothetical protein